MDIQRFAVMNAKGFKTQTSLATQAQLLKELYELNPDIGKDKFWDLDGYWMRWYASDLLLGIASRYNLDDIKFYIQNIDLGIQIERQRQALGYVDDRTRAAYDDLKKFSETVDDFINSHREDFPLNARLELIGGAAKFYQPSPATFEIIKSRIGTLVNSSTPPNSSPNSDKKIALQGSTKSRDYSYKYVSVEERINAVFLKYDLGVASPNDIQYENLPGGIPNRLPLKLMTAQGNFVLKVIGESREEARFIVSAIRYLYKQGNIPVPMSIKTKNSLEDKTDSYFIQIGNYFYILEEFKDGRYIDRLKAEPEHMRTVGKMLSEVHRAFAEFIPEGGKTAARAVDILSHRHEFQEFKERLDKKPREQLTRGEIFFLSLYDKIMEQFDILEKRLPEERYENLPKIVVHGDLSFPNLLFSERGEIVAILDFERSRFQPRVEDFKNPLMSVDPVRGRAYDYNSLVDLVSSYQAYAIDKLTIAEISAISEILRATFLWEFASRFILRISELDQDMAYKSTENVWLKFEEFKKDFPGDEESIQRFIDTIERKSDSMKRERGVNSPIDMEPGQDSTGKTTRGIDGSAGGSTGSASLTTSPLTTGSPSIPQTDEATGGIDFRALPIVTESIMHLKAVINNVPRSDYEKFDITKEIDDLEKMVNAGMSPSTDRIKEYLQASCVKGASQQDLKKVLSCIAGILRNEEETCCDTDPVLKDMLVVLEVSRTPKELQEIFLPVIK